MPKHYQIHHNILNCPNVPQPNTKTPCHQWRGRWHKQWPKSSHNWAPHSPKLVQQWWRWQWPLIFIIIVGLTSPLQEDDRGHSGQYVQSDQGQQTRWKVEIKNKKLFFFYKFSLIKLEKCPPCTQEVYNRNTKLSMKSTTIKQVMKSRKRRNTQSIYPLEVLHNYNKHDMATPILTSLLKIYN